MHNKLLILGKNHYHKKKKDFIGENNIIVSFFFSLVMCHEPRT
jgi:hypothetical protein